LSGKQFFTIPVVHIDLINPIELGFFIPVQGDKTGSALANTRTVVMSFRYCSDVVILVPMMNDPVNS